MAKSDGRDLTEKQLRALVNLSEPCRIRFKDGSLYNRGPDGICRNNNAEKYARQVRRK